jgi:3-methyl-2-oxobutanoate hydroxymethyltransferase
MVMTCWGHLIPSSRKFAKRYANIAEIATQAFSEYAKDVRAGRFPDDKHSYHMKQEEAQKLAAILEKKATR